MRGVNKVLVSGLTCERIVYSKTGNGSDACTFSLVSERPGSNGAVVSACIKCNVYSTGLVEICKWKLSSGVYVIVDGELMNRDGHAAELTEIRVRDIIFVTNLTRKKND